MFKRSIILLVALLIAAFILVNCAAMERAGLYQEAEWNQMKIMTIFTLDFEVDCAIRNRYDGIDCDWDSKRMKVR